MLMRFDPFRELDRMSQVLGTQSAASRQPMMPMDAYRDGDRFIVCFDLPGVKPDSIELVLEKNVLTARAERRWEPAEGQEVIVRERPQGVFTRQLFLGDSLNGDSMTASYDQGVLNITIPISEQAKPHRVPVNAGASGRQPVAASTSGGGSR